MTGQDLLRHSSAFLRGYRAGSRVNPHPYRWAWLLTFLAVLLFGTSLGLTWTAAELALQHTSIGDAIAPTRIGKMAAWLRIYKPGLRDAQSPGGGARVGRGS